MELRETLHYDSLEEAAIEYGKALLAGLPTYGEECERVIHSQTKDQGDRWSCEMILTDFPGSFTLCTDGLACVMYAQECEA